MPHGQMLCGIFIPSFKGNVYSHQSLQLGPAVNKEFQKQWTGFVSSIYPAANTYNFPANTDDLLFTTPTLC